MIVRLEPFGTLIDCALDSNLLDTLIKHDVPISYSCRNGNCNMCALEQVAFDDGRSCLTGSAISMPVSAKRLACQIQVQENIAVHLPQERPVQTPAHLKLRAKVECVGAIHPSIMRLVCTLDRPVNFLPGQHFSVSFSKNVKRKYSAANLSGEASLVFYIERHEEGVATGLLEDELAAGDTLVIEGPYGNSYLIPDDSTPVLLASVGVGFGALVSAMESLKTTNPTRRVIAIVDVPEGLEEMIQTLLLPARNKLMNADVKFISLYKSIGRTSKPQNVSEAIREMPQNFCGWSANVFGRFVAMMPIRNRLIDQGVDPQLIYLEPYTPS
ncbi:FAD-binding oxidoreductase [Sphingorhabdus sp. EL138]|uniref:FAD-binding oxidoreductase n=1 Tax=Sphingorhabdus sp. EL138 TaxID=2073156 RepID=UPI0025DD65BA|nr:FAD-binding oxidoreductase [Sphingorhabdus sp. EL138]